MSCLSDFWKLLLVDSLTVLQMAEPTGRLHLDSQMYSLTKESQFVIESFQILKELCVQFSAKLRNKCSHFRYLIKCSKTENNLVQDFTANIPDACTFGKVGLPRFWHTAKVFVRQNAISFPKQLSPDYTGPREEWYGLTRSLLISPLALSMRRRFILLLLLLFFSFPRRLDIIGGQVVWTMKAR